MGCFGVSTNTLNLNITHSVLKCILVIQPMEIYFWLFFHILSIPPSNTHVHTPLSFSLRTDLRARAYAFRVLFLPARFFANRNFFLQRWKKKKKASIVHVILFYINYSYNGKGTSHEVKFGFECWLHDTLPVWL